MIQNLEICSDNSSFSYQFMPAEFGLKSGKIDVKIPKHHKLKGGKMASHDPSYIPEIRNMNNVVKRKNYKSLLD